MRKLKLKLEKIRKKEKEKKEKKKKRKKIGHGTTNDWGTSGEDVRHPAGAATIGPKKGIGNNGKNHLKKG
jgi:hypothetical protein